MQELSFIPIKTAVFGSILWVFSYLQISWEVFLILTILMAIDFISGIAKSYALGLDITSQKGWYGIIKKILTLIVLISLALLLKIGGVEAGFSLTVVMWLFATAEVFSTLQNIVEYHTRTPISEFNATKFILENLVKLLRNKIGK